MTPKVKAKSLVDKYWIYLRAGLLYDEEAKEDAKHCALIAVDEILQSFGLTTNGQTFYTEYRAVQFWEQVKQK